MRRRTLVLVVLAAVLVSAVATWIANEQIRSPAEVAAETAAPKASPILVPVQRRVLGTKVVTRGTAHYGSPRELSVTPSELKSGPRVVTRLPRDGDVLGSGAVLMTISGRPVFLLAGAQPSYRDLGPGMTGRDVRQLEQALRRARLSPGAVDGRYDSSTGAAVEALYRRHGFAPVVASEAQLAGSRPRQAALVEGTRARAGVQVPSDEVVFVTGTPVRVTKRLVSLGAAPDGGLVTVTDSAVVVDGLLPVDQADLVKPGDKVVIDEPALGIDTTGHVVRVAPRPGTNGADGFHVFFAVAVERPQKSMAGASVRLTIPIKTTSQPELTVPVSAVSLGADGGARVQRAKGRTVEPVSVKTGLSADGFVAVTPVRGDLSQGDMVVVGFKSGRRAGG
jgi:peptidoglycan hydrolase-like protein with peptidoglycan-binding domain